jgi:hypothetical protein
MKKAVICEGNSQAQLAAVDRENAIDDYPSSLFFTAARSHLPVFAPCENVLLPKTCQGLRSNQTTASRLVQKYNIGLIQPQAQYSHFLNAALSWRCYAPRRSSRRA